jgi:hypothetical protein
VLVCCSWIWGGRRTSTAVVAGVEGADEEGEGASTGCAKDEGCGLRHRGGSHGVVCDLG